MKEAIKNDGTESFQSVFLSRDLWVLLTLLKREREKKKLLNRWRYVSDFLCVSLKFSLSERNVGNCCVMTTLFAFWRETANKFLLGTSFFGTKRIMMMREDGDENEGGKSRDASTQKYHSRSIPIEPLLNPTLPHFSWRNGKRRNLHICQRNWFLKAISLTEYMFLLSVAGCCWYVSLSVLTYLTIMHSLILWERKTHESSWLPGEDDIHHSLFPLPPHILMSVCLCHCDSDDNPFLFLFFFLIFLSVRLRINPDDAQQFRSVEHRVRVLLVNEDGNYSRQNTPFKDHLVKGYKVTKLSLNNLLNQRIRCRRHEPTFPKDLRLLPLLWGHLVSVSWPSSSS